MTAGSQEKKKITFGLEIKLDKNTSFNFRLDGDLSEELVEKSLDKAFDYLKEQQPNENYKHSYFMTYNSTNENWNKLDVEEELGAGEGVGGIRIRIAGQGQQPAYHVLHLRLVGVPVADDCLLDLQGVVYSATRCRRRPVW